MDNQHTQVTSNIIQESSDMLIGEGYDLKSPNNIPGFKETTNFRPNYSAQNQQKNLFCT
jgi:hypothetical protein